MVEDPERGHVIGRYVLYDEIASGGMARVHLGMMMGPAGFSRTVAIKRPHAQFAKDPQFVAMFLDEARLAARIIHRNVVPTIDVVAADDEVLLVMEYVPGVTLSRLRDMQGQRTGRMPVPIVCTIMSELLHGLHAAHEAKNERGEPLKIVHRDVSPQNVLLGRDGTTRVLDFGVAKAASRLQTTRDGNVKGKLSYMAPEQLTRRPVDHRADIFAASIIFWELLTGERLFQGDDAGEIISRVLFEKVRPPGEPALDAIVLQGLEPDPAARFATAEEMARAIERAGTLAAAPDISKWLEEMAGDDLSRRAVQATRIETLGATKTAETVTVDEGAAAVPAPVRRGSRRSMWPWTVLAIVLVGASGAWTLARPRAPVAGAPVPEPAVVTRPSSASGEPESPSPPAAPSPPASTAAAKPTSAAHKTNREVHTSAPHARPNCSPNYVYDDAGLKHFKRECL